jgi:hypothetical protein
MTPWERGHVMSLSARIGLLLGMFLGGALLACWFGR